MRSRHAVAAIARHRRPRPVGRQLDLIGQILAASAVQNASWRAIALSGSLSLAQHLVLPQRVVGILHRQRRQAPAHCPRAARRIGARKIAPQRRQRPAVAGNVMQQQQQHVLVRRQAQTDAPAAAARCARSKPRRAAAGSASASAASLDRDDRQAAAAPPRPPGSAAAAPRACRGRSCAGSRGAPPRRPAPPPAPRRSSAPVRRSASGIV